MIPLAERLSLSRRESITFVQHHDARYRIHLERLQDGINRRHLLVEIGCGGIDDVQQHVGITQFIQRGAKGADQIFGKVTDKPDGIGHNNFAIMRKAQAAAGGVQRFKQAVLRRDLADSAEGFD